MFHKMMEEWLIGEQRKILFPKYKEEDVFMLEEFVNYLDCMVRQAAQQSVYPTLPESPRVPFFCKNCNSWHCEKCLNDTASGSRKPLGFNMQKIVLSTSAEKFLSDLPEGATGIMIGNEYIPFSRFAKVKGDTIWLKPNTASTRRGGTVAKKRTSNKPPRG